MCIDEIPPSLSKFTPTRMTKKFTPRLNNRPDWLASKDHKMVVLDVTLVTEAEVEKS